MVLLKYFSEDYLYETIICSSIVIIVLYAIYCYFTNKQGTWSSNVYYSPYEHRRQLSYIAQTNNNLNISNDNKGDSKGEIECRKVLQDIFKRPFNKIRPEFLRNTVTGQHNLELDCYNNELKIAVEYNGIQHYKYTPFFHKNNEAFLNQKYRDYMKRQLCKENGITLIEVPYTVKLSDIRSYIINQLKLKNKLI